LFIKELMKEADIGARETGDTKIRGIHVNRSINVRNSVVLTDDRKRCESSEDDWYIVS
jgi:hypothetical protein